MNAEEWAALWVLAGVPVCTECGDVLDERAGLERSLCWNCESEAWYEADEARREYQRDAEAWRER